MQRSCHQNFRFPSSYARCIILSHAVIFSPVGPTNLVAWTGEWGGFLRDVGQILPALQELHKINGSSRQVQMDREEPQNSHNVVRAEDFAGLVLTLIRSPKHFTALSQTHDCAGSD